MIIGVSGKAGSGKDTVADHLVKEYGFVKVALADPMKRFCMEVFDFTKEQLWGESEKRNAPDERYCRGFRMKCGCLVDEWSSVVGEAEWWAEKVLKPCEEHRRASWWVEERYPPPPPPKEYLTPRYALQQLGTEWGRNCHSTTWVDYALRVAKKILTPYDPNHKIVKEGWLCYTQTEGFDGTFDINKPGGVVISDIRFRNEFAAIKEVGKVVRVKRDNGTLMGDAAHHQSETELDDVWDDDFDLTIENYLSKESLLMKVDQMMAVFSGRIVPYDEEKKDVPPFKR